VSHRDGTACAQAAALAAARHGHVRDRAARSCSLIIVGALLIGGTRGNTAACEASYSVGGVSPLSSKPRARCPGKTVKVAVRKTISATARLACTAGQAADSPT
jgi:hypothetical protein